MANELVTILHKLDRDTEKQAHEREEKQLSTEKEGERKNDFRSWLRRKAEGTAWNADVGHDV